MKLNAEIVEKISKKTNEPYLVIEIQITDTYKKLVFFDTAELELVKLYLASQK